MKTLCRLICTLRFGLLSCFFCFLLATRYTYRRAELRLRYCPRPVPFTSTRTSLLGFCFRGLFTDTNRVALLSFCLGCLFIDTNRIARADPALRGVVGDVGALFLEPGKLCLGAPIPWFVCAEEEVHFLKSGVSNER